MHRIPVIAVTAGDASGIGYELAVRAAIDPAWRGRAEFVLYGAGDVLREAAVRWGGGTEIKTVPVGDLAFADVPVGGACARCGKAAYDALTQATLDVLYRKCDALVTAPMNKYSVNLAGIKFTGHTERIAELCSCGDFVMMQSAGDLRMVFATCHIPIAEVSRQLTRRKIVRVAELLAEAVKSEGIAQPRLAAAALNPHAGENGCMGMEDEKTVKPALEELRNQGISVEGPFPPDTLFIPGTRERFDGIIAMYHDQGHIPFKMLAFDRGVNSTLGLPIIRTSPDHGTAFDIAWRGVAGMGSFNAAIELAVKRAQAVLGSEA